MAHLLVLGNEKGGSGKSTAAMHLATALARAGLRVGAVDLDLRQQTLARYLANRRAHAARHGLSLPTPELAAVPDEGTDERRLAAALDPLSGHDAVVIDCPGAHTRLSQLAHALADTLVTPMNDSFVDFDLLARFDAQTNRVLGPSVYAEMVWQARQARASAGMRPVDWVVMRNRIGPQTTHNRRRLDAALASLARRIGFRLVAGFGERVVFRELFPRGLTLLDLHEAGGEALNLSQVAARQELRDLVAALNLPRPAGVAA